ncbi:CDP-archaeol synthase [Thiocystis minor]|uniref:CDP-archaeol synthase n=1 Tax=Thiocystis minor TaxID=61597 RepID=UPI001F5DA7B5|nr:CDP-archaeol synthase [Thiocystis minor]
MLDALLLVSWANGVPVAVRLLLGDRWASPVDGGAVFYDGRPWLGASKTWRGWFSSVLTTPFVAVFLGLSWELGLVAVLGAMLGDSATSFFKRRFGFRSGASVPVLDQVPESLIPALALQTPLSLTTLDLALVVSGFWMIDQLLTPVARRLRRAGRDLH